MMPSTPPVTPFPLSTEELNALGRQGFVSREDRGGGRVTYKLRFRLGGRQHVRYLGADGELVEQVRELLLRLQRATRQARELRDMRRQARRGLRAAKARLAPLLGERGYHFHGLAVRKRRPPSAAKATAGPAKEGIRR
jgi:hypothetical protein